MQPSLEIAPLPRRRPDTHDSHQKAVEKAIQLMCQDPSAALDWDALSRTACVSRYHFLRIFEELTQVSPHRYLVALRMDLAKRLLLTTAMTVADICLRVGYNSASTFIHAFESLVGITPKEFRRLAEALPSAPLRSFVADQFKNPQPAAARNIFRINLKAPESFAGVVFIGLCDSAIPHFPPFASTILNEPGSVQFDRLKTDRGACLLAVGFSEATDLKSCLLPDRRSFLFASAMVPVSPEGGAKNQDAVLNLRNPSAFDPPILVCLPLLLNPGCAHAPRNRPIP